MTLKIKLLTKSATLPRAATAGAAGMDIRADESIRIQPNETRLVHTGLAVEIPRGFVGLMFPRSSIYRTPLRQPNSVGVIDSDYRGEIRAMFDNRSNEAYDILAGDRVAQLVIVPFQACECVAVDELTDTARGEGGFGSTGVR